MLLNNNLDNAENNDLYTWIDYVQYNLVKNI